MLRWLLFLVAVASLWWIYQRDYGGRGTPAPAWKAAAPSATLPPGGRLGGGLDPFVTDTDVDAPPQRPRAP